MKTKDISGLERNQGRNLLMGFALSLALVWMAFEWTVDDVELYTPSGDVAGIVEEIEVVRTVHPAAKSVPPPKAFRASDRIDPVVDTFFYSNLPVVDTTIAFKPTGPVNEDPPVRVKNTPPPPKPKWEEEEAPLVISEIMPRFPGCEERGMTKEERRICSDQKLLEFLYQNLEYPAAARDNGIDGKVLVQFVVEKDGSITNARVVRDIGGGCGQAVLKVVGTMPRWIPGSQQGRKVRVLFSLPVRFEMNE